MFVDSVRGFKERYYVIKPMTEAARESLYRTKVVVEDGVQVHKREYKFPLAWSYEHFRESPNSYLVKDEALTEEERACFGKLRAYVESFTPEPCLTKEGLSLLDADEQPMFEARLINTKAVLHAPSKDARKELLGKIKCFPFLSSPSITCL
jgi:hypothetical protein